MKTKRRHELQTNTLADWLAKHMETIRPLVGWISIVVILLMAAYLGWSYMSSTSETETVDGWNQLNKFSREAEDAMRRNETAGFVSATDEIGKLVTQFPGTTLSTFASATQGDLHLLRGQTLMWTKREDALKSLEQAAAKYAEAVSAADDPLLKERLQMSLATAQQWMFQVDEAKQSYEKVTGIYGPTAKEQLAAIQLAQRDNLFNRLQQYRPVTPPPSDRPGGDFSSPDKDLQKEIPGGDPLKSLGDDFLPGIGPPVVQPTGSSVPAVQSSGDAPSTDKK